MNNKDRIAQLAREEHEFREGRRKAKKKLRGFKDKHPVPRSIRDRRTAGKHENLAPEVQAQLAHENSPDTP